MAVPTPNRGSAPQEQESDVHLVVLAAPVTSGGDGPTTAHRGRRGRRRLAVFASALLVTGALAASLPFLGDADDDTYATPRPDQRTADTVPDPARLTPTGRPARATSSLLPVRTSAQPGPSGTGGPATGPDSPRPTGGRGATGAGGGTAGAPGASGTSAGGGSSPDGTTGRTADENSTRAAAVSFTDPAPRGDAYVEVPHCARLTGTALIPQGTRLWFAVRYTGDARYQLMGPAELGALTADRRTRWSKVIRLGNPDQYLKGRVIALFVPQRWADYLMAARGYDDQRPLLDSGKGDPLGISAPVLPPDSSTEGELKVQRDRSAPCD
ncbi:hypothetical protein ACIQ6Y_33790 [Streptomyces sp. NPDC096205]|uniref:hypothetical protein n=1 Tax=Streptomyces sp. NPDC096205 TaxID=3366081 RepID=UPI00381E3B1A